jgi:hypothetical protein
VDFYYIQAFPADSRRSLFRCGHCAIFPAHL